LRHIDQITKDKDENDAVLAKALKRKAELEDELSNLHEAVLKAMNKA
jgi:hypothetical protein